MAPLNLGAILVAPTDNWRLVIEVKEFVASAKILDDLLTWTDFSLVGEREEKWLESLYNASDDTIPIQAELAEFGYKTRGTKLLLYVLAWYRASQRYKTRNRVAMFMPMYFSTACLSRDPKRVEAFWTGLARMKEYTVALLADENAKTTP